MNLKSAYKKSSSKLGGKLRKVINNWQKEKKENEEQNRVEFGHLERAVNDRRPIAVFDAETFACCVSIVGQFAPL